MGNVDARCRYDHGYLVVQTAKPFYMPGEVITGNIYLRAMAPLDVKHIDIQIKGTEKGSFVQRVNRDNEWHDEKRKMKKEIIHYSQPCFTFAVPVLNPGDFVIPF